jgi:hypothetical protein
MSEKLSEKIIAYRTAVSIVKSMLVQGIISAEEYHKIDTMLAEKYGLSSCTIFCENSPKTLDI